MKKEENTGMWCKRSERRTVKDVNMASVGKQMADEDRKAREEHKHENS